MTFYIENINIVEKEIDCIITYIFYPLIFSKSMILLNKTSNNYIKKILKIDNFLGKLDTTLLLYNVPNIKSKRILIIGCGKKKLINVINYQKFIKPLFSILFKKNISSISFFLLDLLNKDNNIYWLVRRFIEDFHIIMQKYLFIKFKKICPIYMKNLIIFLNIKTCLFSVKIKKAIQHANALMKGIVYTKNISNMPPNKCNAKFLSICAKKLENKYPKHIKTTILDKNDLNINNMHAYLAVSKGSKNQPFMSIIQYSSLKDINENPIILIGKGVTFDSGGLSLKPAKKMSEMKFDMSGAASIYGTIISIAELRLPIKVIGILAGCENTISSNSYRPGDIIKTMSGKKIEIINTDAEGRLILCDVLTYIQSFKPSIVIDVATLTGACVIALGDVYSGLFSNNNSLIQDLINAGNRSRDLIWPLPLHKKYKNELTSKFADFVNSGSGIADASVAGYFLSIFAKKYKWAHIDIAGTAWSTKESFGSSGRPNSLLFEFLLEKSKTNV